MIKAVVFDLGKVLVDFDYGIAARALAARSRVPIEEVRHVIDQSQLLVTYEMGKLATKLFYNEVCEATGFCGDVDEFGRLFGDIFTPIEDMIEAACKGCVRRTWRRTSFRTPTNSLWRTFERHSRSSVTLTVTFTPSRKGR
jgi:hypothetical protein